jgi:hypothetical protein
LQEKLQEARERLQAEQSGEESSPSAEELQKALEQALSELSERDPSQSMRDAAEMMRSDDPTQASPDQEQALRDLAALYHVLLTSQQSMQMALMQNEATSLRRLAADLLTLSARQEEVADLVPHDLRDVHSGDLTRRQFRVLKASRALRDRLQDLSSSSPMEIMRLLNKLDGLIEELDLSVRNLESGRGKAAQHSSRQSLGNMNELIIGLLTQAQKSCSSSGSCAMPNLSQQLQQMAREQAGLNGLTEALRRQLQEYGLSQEQRAQMERLSGEQGQLADGVREVAEMERQLENGERLLGDLEQLAGDMERVVQDLDAGLVNEETLVRQERILSRLLDAHNSARQRDFSTRRQSRTADQLYVERDDAEGPASTADERIPFRLRYQPVEKAPLEYRELVRQYFRGVERLHQDSTGGIDAGEQP